MDARGGGAKVDTTAGSSGCSGGSVVPVANGSGGGSGPCTISYNGRQYPCTDPKYGWWYAAEQCYVQQLTPQQAADVAPGRGGTVIHAPGGDVEPELAPDTVPYWCTSPDNWTFRQVVGLPPGTTGPAAPVVDPAVLAQQAVDSMGLRPPAIGTTPPAGSPEPGLVGLPTWMWVAEPGPTTWGPVTATAAAAGVTVTATAKVSSVSWDMGDGSTVQCGAGTPYQRSYGDAPSPTCGHRYTAPGTHTITATTNWVVDWTASTGANGTIAIPLNATSQIDLAEAYALVARQG
jgi:hypothetical protein